MDKYIRLIFVACFLLMTYLFYLRISTDQWSHVNWAMMAITATNAVPNAYRDVVILVKFIGCPLYQDPKGGIQVPVFAAGQPYHPEVDR